MADKMLKIELKKSLIGRPMPQKQNIVADLFRQQYGVE